MTSHITTPGLPQSEIETSGQVFDNPFDPTEADLRNRVCDCSKPCWKLETELDDWTIDAA